VDPPAGEDQQQSASADGPTSLHRARLQQQEKEFRQTLERLFVRVGDLKGQVQGLNGSDIFSVSVFKQTQEIEKLAKQLKNYSRA